MKIAGGVEPVGHRGSDSVAVRWDAVVEAAPEVLVHRLLRLLGRAHRSRICLSCGLFPASRGLPAVQRDEMYVVNASAFFSRPGPRIADSLEILAEILHPESFRGQFPDRAVARVG